MTINDPTPRDPRGTGNARPWGTVGLAIVGIVVALAVIMTLFGPTDTQQASNTETSPPPSTQTTPPPQP
jgi:hypothetical protein